MAGRVGQKSSVRAVRRSRQVRRHQDTSYTKEVLSVDYGQALRLAGIGFSDDSRRTYPSGSIGCQVLGFVGVGVYPVSGFVHLDVRERSYFWVDTSGPRHAYSKPWPPPWPVTAPSAPAASCRSRK